MIFLGPLALFATGLERFTDAFTFLTPWFFLGTDPERGVALGEDFRTNAPLLKAEAESCLLKETSAAESGRLLERLPLLEPIIGSIPSLSLRRAR